MKELQQHKKMYVGRPRQAICNFSPLSQQGRVATDICSLCLPFVIYVFHLKNCQWLVRINQKIWCCSAVMYKTGQHDTKFLVVCVKNHMKTDVLITVLQGHEGGPILLSWPTFGNNKACMWERKPCILKAKEVLPRSCLSCHRMFGLRSCYLIEGLYKHHFQRPGRKHNIATISLTRKTCYFWLSHHLPTTHWLQGFEMYQSSVVWNSRMSFRFLGYWF